MDPRILSGLVGLQLRWPDEYRDLSESVLSDDPDPFAPLRTEDQGSLQRYVELFFQQYAMSEQLRPYVQLTQAVAVSIAEDADRSGEAEGRDPEETRLAREQNVRELTALLIGMQYVERGGVYINPANTSIRFRFGKTVIRYEERAEVPRTGPRKWVLRRSLNLLTEYDDARQLISKPI
jgi:hypothetical protein